MTITQTASPAGFTGPGQPITYTYRVVNTGTVTLHHVTVTDTLTARGLSEITCTPPQHASLVPMGEMTCTALYATTTADVAAGHVTNTAAAAGLTPDGIRVDDSASVTIQRAPRAPAIAAMTITKTASVAGFTGPGQPITYTYRVKNTGTVTLHNVTVTDTLTDHGLTAITCTPAQGAVLAPLGEMTCTADYTTSVTDVNVGLVTNKATVAGLTPENVSVTVSASVTIEGPQHAPAIAITKTATPPSFTGPGQPITYAYHVVNIGNEELHDVTVTDTLTGHGLSEITCTPPRGGTLVPLADMTCTARYSTTAADVDAGHVSNTGTAEGLSPEDVPVDDSDSVTVQGPERVPGISITKSASLEGFTRPGELVTYTYRVTNIGNVPLHDVTVTDTLTGHGLSPITCEPPQGGRLVPRASMTCTATYTTTGADVGAGFVANTGTAEGLSPEGVLVEDSSSVTVEGPERVPGISITKTASLEGFTRPGELVTYTYKVTNIGNVPLHDVTVTDTLTGHGLSPITCEPPQGGRLVPRASMTCTATYTTTGADVAAGFVANTGMAEGLSPEGVLVEDSSSVTVEGPERVPGISITKAASLEGFTRPGELVTYTYRVRNIGNVPLHGVTVADTLTGHGLSVITCEPPQGGRLVPRASMTCTATYTTTGADVGAGFVANTGTAEGLSPEGVLVEDSSSVTIEGPERVPGISITKTAVPAGFTRPGELVTYMYRVRNIGNVPLHGVTVADTLTGHGLSVITCEPPQGGRLVPRASMTCTATYTTTGADVAAGFVANTGTAEGFSPEDVPVEDSSSVTIEGPERVPGISITKSASPEGFTRPGELVTYAYKVTNIGNVPLHGVTVTDTLTGHGLSPITCEPPQGGRLVPRASMTCTATYTTTGADVAAGFVANTGMAEGLSPEEVLVEDSSSVTIEGPERVAGISITKTASLEGFTRPGELVTYTYRVTNIGNVPLHDVTVTDTLTGHGLSPITCEPPQGGRLVPRASMTCTATYTTTGADVAAGHVANTGIAEGLSPEGVLVEDSSSVTVEGPERVPGISITKTASLEGFTRPGELVTYTYKVTNIGNVPLHGVTVTDTLTGHGLSVIGCEPPQGGRLVPRASMTCTATYTTTGADVAAGFVANTGMAEGLSPEGVLVEDSSSVTVEGPERVPGISITKAASLEGFTRPGELVTYTYRVTNIGNVPLHGVTVTDTLTGHGLSVIGCEPPQGGRLVPRASMTCTATYTTTGADVAAGHVANTGTAEGLSPEEVLVEDSSSVTIEGPERVPGISITKTAVPAGFTRPGELVTYMYRVRNIGNVPLHGVTVTDTLTGHGLSPITCEPPQGGRLVPRASMTCTAMYSTTLGDVEAGGVVNTGTAEGLSPEDVPVEDADSVTVQGPERVPGISITKTASPAGFTRPGELVTYTYHVTNIGNVTLHGVTVSDTLTGHGLSSISCVPPQGSVLVPRASMTCTATYSTTLGDVEAGGVVNTGTAEGLSPEEVLVEDSSSVTIEGPEQVPGISITKTASLEGFTRPGELVTYTYKVTNIGNVPLHDVTVTDTLTGHGLSVIGCEPPQGGRLVPRASMTCTATYTTTGADVAAGHVANTGTAEGFSPEEVLVEDSSSVTIEGPERVPGISITKTAVPAGFTRPGELVTYMYRVRNIGNVPLHGVTVTDTLTGHGLSPITCEPPQGGRLVPRASMTCTAMYSTTLGDVEAGGVVNTGTAEGLSPEDVPVEDADSVTVQGPERVPAISITKTASPAGFTRPGELVTYTYRVRNIGNVTLHDVTVTDTLTGHGLSVISCVPPQGGRVVPRASMTCTATYTITAADVDAGHVTNTGTATGLSPQHVPVDDSDSVTVEGPRHAPAIAIIKTARPASFTGPGQRITYTYQVKNIGNVTLHDVTVTDNKIRIVTCPAATLAPGASMNCTARYTTKAADVNAGYVTNTGTDAGLSPEGVAVKDSDSVTVKGPRHAPAIRIIKTARPASFSGSGERITYTYRVKNVGNVTLHGVTVTDNKIRVVTCPRATLAPGASMNCRARYTTKAANVKKGRITNTGTATGITPTGAKIRAKSTVVLPFSRLPEVPVTG